MKPWNFNFDDERSLKVSNSECSGLDKWCNDGPT